MKQNFSFEKYIKTLQKSFVDLKSTGEHISEERKVRILLNGISDNHLKAVKNQVLAMQALHDTFENATNFLSQALDSKVSYSAVPRNTRISSLNTNTDPPQGHLNRGRLNKSNRPNKQENKRRKLTDGYYAPSAWEKLTPAEKQKVCDLCTERDKKLGVSAVNTDITNWLNDNKTPTNNVGDTMPTEAQGIGAIMSQRHNKVHQTD